MFQFPCDEPRLLISPRRDHKQAHPALPSLSRNPRLGVEKVATYDTAGSAKMIAEQDLKGCAAIASDLAAEAWDMEVLATNIEDDSVNFTRFLLLARQVIFPCCCV